MKNIHVLPTDKPSRLFITDGKLFNYHKPQEGDGVKIINQNIYITSDEEIKEGDYGLLVNEIISYNKMIELWGVTQGWKIILTTDQDLIKDGVQAIDDEFLEWFVKNPSCEMVEIEDFPMTEKYNSKGEYIHRSYWVSKIIIPKDEPKQEFPTVNGSYGCTIPKEEPKQETLEEAAERFYSSEDSQRDCNFIEGARWQQKRMYSEEEVKKLIELHSDFIDSKIDYDGINNATTAIYNPEWDDEEWFEQFKNK